MSKNNIIDFLDKVKAKTDKLQVELSNGNTIGGSVSDSKTIQNIVKLIFTSDKSTVGIKYEESIEKLLDAVFDKEIKDVPYTERTKLIIAARCLSLGSTYIDREDKSEYDITENFNLSSSKIGSDVEKAINSLDGKCRELIGPPANFAVKYKVPTIGEAREIYKRLATQLKKNKQIENQIFTQQCIEIAKYVSEIYIKLGDEEVSFKFDDLSASEVIETINKLPQPVTDMILEDVNVVTEYDKKFIQLDDSKHISIDPLFFSKR